PAHLLAKLIRLDVSLGWTPPLLGATRQPPHGARRGGAGQNRRARRVLAGGSTRDGALLLPVAGWPLGFGHRDGSPSELAAVPACAGRRQLAGARSGPRRAVHRGRMVSR